jgi:hypothetical protein
MNPLIQLKPTTLVLLAAYGLACFGLSSSMKAVTPAPDGGPVRIIDKQAPATTSRAIGVQARTLELLEPQALH